MLSRRGFLTLVLSLVPATSVRAAPRRRNISAEEREAFAGLVGDATAARAIGRDALKSCPHRLRSESIARALARLDPPHDSEPTIGPATLRERYQAALRHDFARSRIVDVGGWQLAETEVCLFAYLALESDPGTSVN